jgi:hypothetical protein
MQRPASNPRCKKLYDDAAAIGLEASVQSYARYPKPACLHATYGAKVAMSPYRVRSS